VGGRRALALRRFKEEAVLRGWLLSLGRPTANLWSVNLVISYFLPSELVTMYVRDTVVLHDLLIRPRPVQNPVYML
jgi:hypothetical protein